jgi:hypothetical protein
MQHGDLFFHLGSFLDLRSAIRLGLTSKDLARDLSSRRFWTDTKLKEAFLPACDHGIKPILQRVWAKKLLSSWLLERGLGRLLGSIVRDNLDPAILEGCPVQPVEVSLVLDSKSDALVHYCLTRRFQHGYLDDPLRLLVRLSKTREGWIVMQEIFSLDDVRRLRGNHIFLDWVCCSSSKENGLSYVGIRAVIHREVIDPVFHLTLAETILEETCRVVTRDICSSYLHLDQWQWKAKAYSLTPIVELLQSFREML